MKQKCVFGVVVGALIGYVVYLRRGVKVAESVSEYSRHHVFGRVLTVRPYGEPGKFLVMIQRKDGSIFEAVVSSDFELTRESYPIGEWMWIDCNLT